MPIQEILMLAVTRMQGGVCIAGMSTEPDPASGLRWVRPVREYGHVLLGDVRTAEGAVVQPFDVVEFNLLRPRAMAPQTEDWTADFVHHRPRVLRRLGAGRRSRFLGKYLDSAPREVLDGQQRSLCLIRPEWIRGCFRLDGYSGRFDARMSFGLEQRSYLGSYARGGMPVTDLKWRALGRSYLPAEGGWLEFDAGDLEVRLGTREVYLAIGLTRAYRGTCWPIVVGVHTVPDYEVTIDYDNL